jgi:nondiscriminating glutamyl-tRNA synthetase
MTTPSLRVRFAPAPTGLMHLGNVRTALMNYLFARQRNGVFVVRVEDTDQQRNFDPGAKHILDDLAWLGITYDEGPGKGGPYAPYFQSERTALYQEKLQELINKDAVYRCFCTAEELERKRQRQITLKHPPRYDRACLTLSAEQLSRNLDNAIPFIWRIKLPQQGSVDINDLARGIIHFDLKNFSDTPLTRQDGSFTFLFANFVDDLTMNITHIFRGEDHLTNTAVQAMLYTAFQTPLPTYWHMPILCNALGKKLSKRDFGFSLNDLRQGGYLPEAICNYLAIIGGSFVTEIMSMDDLSKVTDFNHLSTAGQIKYDVEKLMWVNHKWIELYDPTALMQRCLPYLQAVYPQTATLDPATLTNLIQAIKSELTTLNECPRLLHFYFARPQVTHQELDAFIAPDIRMRIATLIAQHLPTLAEVDTFMNAVKADAKQAGIPLKDVFHFLRLALMGQPNGPAIHELIAMLGAQEAVERLKKCL